MNYYNIIKYVNKHPKLILTFNFNIMFEINKWLLIQYPELVELIKKTESMDNNEKQYWFDILPSMTDEQVDRLFDILEIERKKLEELESEYQDEIKNLNEKHLIEWQEYKAKIII